MKYRSLRAPSGKGSYARGAQGSDASRKSPVAGCRLPPEIETEHPLSSPSRILIALLIVACAFTQTGVAAANPSASLE